MLFTFSGLLSGRIWNILSSLKENQEELTHHHSQPRALCLRETSSIFSVVWLRNCLLFLCCSRNKNAHASSVASLWEKRWPWAVTLRCSKGAQSLLVLYVAGGEEAKPSQDKKKSVEGFLTKSRRWRCSSSTYSADRWRASSYIYKKNRHITYIYMSENKKQRWLLRSWEVLGGHLLWWRVRTQFLWG